MTIMEREINTLQKGPFTRQMNLNSQGSPRIANETLHRVGEVFCAAGKGQLGGSREINLIQKKKSLWCF